MFFWTRFNQQIKLEADLKDKVELVLWLDGFFSSHAS